MTCSATRLPLHESACIVDCRSKGSKHRAASKGCNKADMPNASSTVPFFQQAQPASSWCIASHQVPSAGNDFHRVLSSRVDAGKYTSI